MIFIVAFIAIGGGSTRLTCIRVDAGKLINCTKQSRWLWLLPTGEEQIGDVRGANLAYSSGVNGGSNYRVELQTAKGVVPLTSLYTSGYSKKRDAIDKINDFVKSVEGGTLVVTEPGLLSGENLICLLVWIPISFFLNTIWGLIKSNFSQTGSE